MGTVWILAIGLGTIALAVVLFFGMSKNRKHHSAAEIARTEAATRDLYAREDAASHEDDVPR